LVKPLILLLFFTGIGGFFYGFVSRKVAKEQRNEPRRHEGHEGMEVKKRKKRRFEGDFFVIFVLFHLYVNFFYASSKG
jgi:hypothetical protein